MSKTMERTDTKDLQVTTSPATNVADLAEAILAQSLEFCAQKMALSTPEAAKALLCQGDHVACRYWHYALAQYVAKELGTWDEDIKAVYIAEYDATPEDLCFCEATPSAQVHLIVWSKRKTAALNSLAGTMDHALVECCAEQIGLPKLSHLLDVQIIDDADVERRVGYGALLSSLYHQPIQVWPR